MELSMLPSIKRILISEVFFFFFFKNHIRISKGETRTSGATDGSSAL